MGEKREFLSRAGLRSCSVVRGPPWKVSASAAKSSRT